MRFLSARTGNNILLKREDLRLFFFQIARRLQQNVSALGRKLSSAVVVAASAGNRTQGLALAAARMGVKAFIVILAHRNY